MSGEFYRCSCCKMFHRAGFEFARDAKSDEPAWVWSKSALPKGAVIIEAPVLMNDRRIADHRGHVDRATALAR